MRLKALYDTAYAAVMHGVYWEGIHDGITGVTKDEALTLAADFFRETGPGWLDRWEADDDES